MDDTSSNSFSETTLGDFYQFVEIGIFKGNDGTSEKYIEK